MSELSIGLLGCGRVAEVAHLPALQQTPSAKVVALAEPLEERLNHGLSVFPSASSYDDFRTLLDNETLDAVIIGLPSGLHAEAACEAIDRRLHIYCEKPLATDFGAAKEVVQRWKNTQLVGMMGLNLRRNPLYRKAVDVIESGALGTLSGIRTQFGAPSREQSSWRWSHESGGGALLNLSPHHLDMVQYLLKDNIQHVTALTQLEDSDHTMTMQVQFESGLFGQVFLSMRSYSVDEMHIIGQQASLHIDRRRGFLRIIDQNTYESTRQRLPFEAQVTIKRPVEFLKSRGEPSYVAAIGDFVAASVNGDNSITPDLVDGLRVQAVIDAAWQSATQGGTHQVEMID